MPPRRGRLRVDHAGSRRLRAHSLGIRPLDVDLDAPTSKDTVTAPVRLADGQFRLGDQAGPPDVRFLIGHCVFGSPDAALLVSLLPRVVHIRGDERLATIVQLVGEESRAMRPARDVVLARLLEVLLIETLRSTAGTSAPPGLLRGLADERLGAAIRRMHERGSRFTATCATAIIAG